MIDRQQISQAVAKAIAFKLAGKDEDARHWGLRVVTLLTLGGIIKADDIS
jgi:hypothetical protein